MVKVTVYRDHLGSWVGFKSEGHAMTGGNSQYDLVCAAISMHLQTVEYTLGEKTNLLRRTKKDGYLELVFPPMENLRELEGFFSNGLKILMGSYGKSLKVYDKEVESHV